MKGRTAGRQEKLADIMSAMYNTIAWAKTSPDSKFEKISIERNVAGDEDVTFDVKFCGICHTDVHIAGNDMVLKEFF